MSRVKGDVCVSTKAWTFAFSGKSIDSTNIDTNGDLEVNLSLLSLRSLEGISGYSSHVAQCVIWALSARFGFLPYRQNLGYSFWGRVNKNDRIAVAFWRLLNEVALKSISTLSDIRDFQIIPKKLPIVRRLGFSKKSNINLIVRAGNIELYALHNWLLDKQSTQKAALELAEKEQTINAHDFISLTKQSWWPRMEALPNIAQLRTNAGWYASPSNAIDVLDDWCDRYVTGLQSGLLLPTHAHDMLKLACELPSFRNKKLYKFDDTWVIEKLRDSRVVLVSSFSELALRQFSSGNQEKLWLDAGFAGSMSSLEVIDSPMSVYPYRPLSSWTESFNALCEETALAIEHSSADTLIASCGCYGLPLAHEMNRRFGITCMYIGHVALMYFGVYSRAFHNYPFYMKTKSNTAWALSDLERRFPEVARIDKGRYV